MAYQVTVIEPDGRSTVEALDKVPDNKWIKRRLEGGWLEVIPHFEQYGARPCVAFCDEEGKLKGLPLNPKATYAWYTCLAPEPFRPDQLHGPIVIVTADTPEELEAL